MTPGLSSLDITDRAATHAVHTGQSGLRDLPVNGPDRSHVTFIEFGLVMGHASRCEESRRNGVAHIFGSRGPFKIMNSVVRLIPISVVDPISPARWGKKGLSDEAVNLEMSPATILGECQDEITVMVPVLPEGASDLNALATLDAANHAEVGDFIPAFVSHDGPPLFGFQSQGKLCRMRMHRKPILSVPGGRPSQAALPSNYTTGAEQWT